MTEVCRDIPKDAKLSVLLLQGREFRFWHPNLHFLKAAGSTFSCANPGHCIRSDRTLGSSRIKGSLVQELEKRPGRRDEILPLHSEQGTFSSRVASGLVPASSCLSANAISFKSLNYQPGNHWELFWWCKTQQGQKLSSRFGPAHSAPCRKEILALRTIPGVQNRHSLGSLDFTGLEDIPPTPLGDTGSG